MLSSNTLPKWSEVSRKEYYKAYRALNRLKVQGYSRDWRSKNKEWDVEQNRLERVRVKNDVFSHYSGGEIKCKSCGFNDIRALQLDHINNDGAEERRRVGHSRTSAGGTFYRWLRKNGFPPGYQILCANCNWVKEWERRQT